MNNLAVALGRRSMCVSSYYAVRIFLLHWAISEIYYKKSGIWDLLHKIKFSHLVGELGKEPAAMLRLRPQNSQNSGYLKFHLNKIWNITQLTEHQKSLSSVTMVYYLAWRHRISLYYRRSWFVKIMMEVWWNDEVLCVLCCLREKGRKSEKSEYTYMMWFYTWQSWTSEILQPFPSCCTPWQQACKQDRTTKKRLKGWKMENIKFQWPH